MSEVGPDETMKQLMERIPEVSRIDRTMLENALEGYPYKCKRDWDWLLKAVRVAVYLSHQNGADRLGNADIRDALRKQGGSARKLHREISCLPDEVNESIFYHAFSIWKQSDNPPRPLSTVINPDKPPALAQFEDISARLLWMADFLRDAAASIEKQSTRWRLAESREQRVIFANCLAPIFEKGFGRNAVIRRNSDGDQPWINFYERIRQAVYNEDKVRNIESVLKEARRHRNSPMALFVRNFFENGAIT